ncbi:MAG: 16S rRNA (adenine(1518)-N(6)/adenine(1519)-N(6))-dimethyltransferase RsmA [Candidatus Hinthialibacter antarcticus]|nr:16S rRNA (adenine(1518)-N(6)/adenine(1519)-N(6))-dimethyltransferase RsmA [Candidatus Hinthialibacter antarcticus]
MNVLLESLYSKQGLIAYTKRYGLRLTKALGQHFLIQREWMAAVLNRSEIPREGCVIEIGPGVGHLTWLLLERGLNVVAIEKDRRFAGMIQELAALEPTYKDRLRIIEGDALKTDFKALQEETGARCVIGNLPYNAATPILFHLAYSQAPLECICTMVQKEVGERIMSKSGCKAYGRLSVVLQYLFDITASEVIPPYAFFPAPKVDSLVLKFAPKTDVDAEFAQQFLEKVVHVGFLHRRKKLRTSLKGATVQKQIFSLDFLREAEAQFNFDDRAEQWPVEQWVAFAEYVRSQPVSNPTGV